MEQKASPRGSLAVRLLWEVHDSKGDFRICDYGYCYCCCFYYACCCCCGYYYSYYCFCYDFDCY